MLVYPQLESGALSQFPVLKTRTTRTVVNRAADGSTVRLADPFAGTTEWLLTYAELIDSEAAALREFFEATEGSLNSFVFVDPVGNLFAWSERLDHETWQRDPLMNVLGSIADPRGGTAAWRLVNTGAGEQTLRQTIAGPGDYNYAFSVYVRSDAHSRIALSISDQSVEQEVTPEWTRVWLAARGVPGATSVRFAMTIAAGAAVEVFGPQAEAQGGASPYMASTRGGVYEDAYLAEDQLAITRAAFNRNSCKVRIIHANRL